MVFERVVISHSNIKKNKSGLKPLIIMHLKAHKVVQRGCFFLELFSCNFDDQLSPNVHRFVILGLCIMMGYTKWEYCLWQWPKVSSAFKLLLFTTHSWWDQCIIMPVQDATVKYPWDVPYRISISLYSDFSLWREFLKVHVSLRVSCGEDGW